MAVLSGLMVGSVSDALEDIGQVQLQAWIYETGEQGLRDIGANLVYTRFVNGQEMPTGSVQQINSQVYDPLNTDFSVTVPPPNPALFPAPLRTDTGSAAGIQTQSGAGLTFTILDQDYGSIDGIFRSVKRKSEVDLVSKPELLVAAGTTAQIHAGGQVPYQSVNFDGKGNPTLNVAWENIGVTMDIVPYIESQDTVRIDLTELKVQDIARTDTVQGLDMPVFAERKQTGQVIVPNGSTLVIGGLSSRTVRQAERSIPLLGQVPVLGIPFRGRKSEVDTSHLMIFLSPTIVDLRSLNTDVMDALEFWRGEAWKHTEEVQGEVDTMEDQL